IYRLGQRKGNGAHHQIFGQLGEIAVKNSIIHIRIEAASGTLLNNKSGCMATLTPKKCDLFEHVAGNKSRTVVQLKKGILCINRNHIELFSFYTHTQMNLYGKFAAFLFINHLKAIDVVSNRLGLRLENSRNGVDIFLSKLVNHHLCYSLK